MKHNMSVFEPPSPRHLENANTPWQTSLLTKWLGTEEVAQAQASIVQSLAQHRSADSALALETCANDVEKSHRIRGLALVSLAKQGRYSNEDLIQDYTNDDGWRHSSGDTPSMHLAIYTVNPPLIRSVESWVIKMKPTEHAEMPVQHSHLVPRKSLVDGITCQCNLDRCFARSASTRSPLCSKWTEKYSVKEVQSVIGS